MDAKSELKPSCSTQVYDRLRQPSSPSHIHISTPVFSLCVWNKRKKLLSSSCRVSLHFWSSGAIARSKLLSTDLVQFTIQEAKWQLLLLYCYPEQRRSESCVFSQPGSLLSTIAWSSAWPTCSCISLTSQRTWESGTPKIFNKWM